MIEFPILPSGAPLPLPYRWLRAHGLASLRPWEFADDTKFAAEWREAYVKETGEDAWPFAYRSDRIETAAFVLRDGIAVGEVIILDDDPFDTWGDAPRRPMERFASFKEWFIAAIQESMDVWMSEEELPDVLDE
jgi:hypothetical protein